MFRNGDWPNCTGRASFSVPSNTASPVVLRKSASTMVSLSVSGTARGLLKYQNNISHRVSASSAIVKTAARVWVKYHNKISAAASKSSPIVTIAPGLLRLAWLIRYSALEARAGIELEPALSGDGLLR